MKGIIQGDRYRITVLTDQLIRLEYSNTGIFEDRMTQTVLNRDFPAVTFDLKTTDEEILLNTKKLRLCYDKQKFKSGGLTIELLDSPTNYHSIWRYGEKDVYQKNLKGTARTLDETNGETVLEDGLLSPNGYAVYDDSRSLCINESDELFKREEGCMDLYFFGYGREYRKCLKDFHLLTGKTPLLPRYALGNWWSRYYAYTDREYLQLFDRFEKEEIPFSVAVIDMDWHMTKIDKRYGTGWTGYTWNKELFPDYRSFLKELKKRNLKITLNEHPAAGIKAYEDMYEEAAQLMNMDPEKKEDIPFDITSKEFINVYFKCLHEPYERDGIDFWWLDWQQGTFSKMEGLDPLWMLNHLHFKHSGKNGKRPMIFSRYAGTGSHRYPVGFSGDTYATWEALRFQPYFTAAASNIGFNWWSHDIGGHMYGIKDDELMVRWVQFGVFSPIMRLHSTNHFFNSKEPFRYSINVQEILKNFLRLRHQLIPFLYSVNFKACTEDTALVEPMYYDYPEEANAYQYKNQYLFGRTMIAAPVLEKTQENTYLAKTKVWLPEGNYVDFFTGTRYRGDRCITMYRTLKELPVLVREGSIIPMDLRAYTGNGTALPEIITLKIYAGKSGEFELYEDDGETRKYEEGEFVKTKIHFNWEAKRITIEAAEGSRSLLPENRRYEIALMGVQEEKEISVLFGKEKIKPEAFYYLLDEQELKMLLPPLNGDKDIVITFGRDLCIAGNKTEQKLYELLCNAQIEYDLKARIYQSFQKNGAGRQMIAELLSISSYEDFNQALIEIMTAE